MAPARNILIAGALATVGALVALSGCVSDDDEGTATFNQSGVTQTLPPTTATTTATTDEPDGDDDNETSDGTTSTEATTTTEPLAPLQGLAAEPVATGLDQPIYVTGAPGTEALFVVEREGIIRIVEDGAVADEPFVDLSDQLLSNSIEQGLLGLAFHPDYADNGRFFVYWTAPDFTGTLVELEATGPTSADPGSAQVLLEVPQPGERHNAGMLSFGPDGLLYLALGDGGAGGAEAQDTSTLLGSILRLDVSEPGSYSIPDGNPFDDEIWVYGLRNPWRFSIDAETDSVYIGDVGQEAFEEINVIGLDGAGTNFGWSEAEGDGCFRSGCDLASFQAPTLQYDHQEGCSVTGGYVYRGPSIPEFHGHYFFADWCKSFVRSFRLVDGTVRDQFDWTPEMPELGQVTSFGLDNDGELYAVNWTGEVYRIVAVR